MSEKNLILQSVQLIRAGKLQQANQLLEQLINSSPKLAEAYYYLGVVSAQMQNIPKAILSFERALECKPEFEVAIVSLGNLYSQIGRLDKAVAHYQATLKRGVRTLQILNKLAFALAAFGKLSDAKALFEEIIALDEMALEPYLALAKLHSVSKDFDKALEVYQKAHGKGIKHSNLFNGYFNCLVTTGDIDGAKKIGLECLHDNPLDISMLYNHSYMDSSICDEECESRLSTLDLDSYPPLEQAYIQFVLARCAKKRGDHKTEIDTLLNGHNSFYSAARFHHDLSYYSDVLPSFIYQEKPKLEALSEDKDHRPIFIVGTPRCGSTLLESILWSGDESTKKVEESTIITYALAKSEMMKVKGAADVFRTHVRKGFENLKVDVEKDRFSDKSLENAFFVDVILRLFPNAKIVYCERSAIASIVSILQNNMQDLSWAHDMKSILAYFDLIREAMAHWSQQFPDQVHTVVYEELVNNPEEVSKKLFQFCEMEWSSSCLDFYKKNVTSSTASNVQIRSGINKSALSKEDKYKPYFKALKGLYPWFDKALEG